MFEAQIRRKIPEVVNSEDALTSTVFGILKYSPMRACLAVFLSRAIRYVGEDTRLGSEVSPSDPFDCSEGEVKFWARHGEFGEPDILLVGQDWAIVVEVKLGAEISGPDQLRKYHDLLNNHFQQKTHRHVVYLTKDLAPPILDAKVTRGIERNLWWLSWYDLSPVLQTQRDIPVAREMASDLSRFLDHCGLSLFHGFHTQPCLVNQPLFWDDTTPLMAEHDAWLQRRHFWQEDSK